MSTFNSLGSNYTLASALRMFFAVGGDAREKLTAYLESRYSGKALLTYKGREALSLALQALPKKGAVAINGLTCFAVYEAIVESGNSPLYLDIPDTSLNFTPDTLRGALATHANVVAVVVQNTLGAPCDIAAIAQVCRARGITLIEDLAHSIGATYATGEEAGTVGDFTVLSFSQDKVVDAVAGGALIVRDPTLCKSDLHNWHSVGVWQQTKDRLYPILTWKVRALYPLGIGRWYHRFLRALHLLSTPLGSDARARTLPSWYCANILHQYQALEKVAVHRRKIAAIYQQHLDAKLLLSASPQGSSALRFPILLQKRGSLIEYLRRRSIYVSDIWYDAPIAPRTYMARTNYAGECPHAERIANRILNLPTHINVSPARARKIAEEVNRFARLDAMYEIREVSDKDEWEKFLAEQKPHSFLHSWNWGEHYAAAGSEVHRLGAYQDGALAAVALLIKIPARRGAFLLCPHGPIAKPGHEKEALEALSEEAARIGKEGRCAFIRFCSLDENSDANRARYRSLGFRNAPIHMHPELAWMLDVTKPEEELLKGMRKTTRYLVKKMEKEGVEVTMGTKADDIETFWPVYEATVERQHFTPFKKSELREEFEIFARDGQAAFFFGSYGNEILAAAIIIFWGGQAFYHHSGSVQRSKDINASYLLQWRVIQEAKKRGCTLYNFWGISSEDKPKHPWAGLSLFKKGFGGYAEAYVHAQDKSLAWNYCVNWTVETVRRIRRGL